MVCYHGERITIATAAQHHLGLVALYAGLPLSPAALPAVLEDVGRMTRGIIASLRHCNSGSMMKTTGEPKEPSRPTVKRLFALSGNRCAFPKCKTAIIDPDSGSVIGQVCHIEGEKEGAARWNRGQSAEERHGSDNLILLCGPHHKVIDDDEVAYTVERLKAMKKTHEDTATRVPEPNDEIADRLIATVLVSVAHGSIIFAPNQFGGQAAHSITNILYGPPPAQEDKATRELHRHKLDDPESADFGKTMYSQALGVRDQSGVFVPLPVSGLFFALLPKRIVPRGEEREFVGWMDCNQRRYEPFPGSPFIPSLTPDRIGSSLVWSDGGQLRFGSPARCYTQYLAVEMEGYLEYGFCPGAAFAPDINIVYYARVIAGFVAFLRLLRDLCGRFKLDASAVAVGLALRGIRGRALRCVTKRVERQYQATAPPDQDAFLFFRTAMPGADWGVDEVAHEAAGGVLHLWAYSAPAVFSTPEFEGEKYTGEGFKSDFRVWS
jgi:hypothetical protein